MSLNHSPSSAEREQIIYWGFRRGDSLFCAARDPVLVVLQKLRELPKGPPPVRNVGLFGEAHFGEGALAAVLFAGLLVQWHEDSVPAEPLW